MACSSRQTAELTLVLLFEYTETWRLREVWKNRIQRLPKMDSEFRHPGLSSQKKVKTGADSDVEIILCQSLRVIHEICVTVPIPVCEWAIILWLWSNISPSSLTTLQRRSLLISNLCTWAETRCEMSSCPTLTAQLKKLMCKWEYVHYSGACPLINGGHRARICIWDKLRYFFI